MLVTPAYDRYLLLNVMRTESVSNSREDRLKLRKLQRANRRTYRLIISVKFKGSIAPLTKP